MSTTVSEDPMASPFFSNFFSIFLKCLLTSADNVPVIWRQARSTARHANQHTVCHKRFTAGQTLPGSDPWHHVRLWLPWDVQTGEVIHLRLNLFSLWLWWSWLWDVLLTLANYLLFFFCCQALFKLWGPGDSYPKDVLMCNELVLDSQGRLVQMNRLPGDNEVHQWILKIFLQGFFLRQSHSTKSLWIVEERCSSVRFMQLVYISIFTL